MANDDLSSWRETDARPGRSRPALRPLINHDDAEREFGYTAGAEHALAIAESEGWTVVSIKRDRDTIHHEHE